MGQLLSAGPITQVTGPVLSKDIISEISPTDA